MTATPSGPPPPAVVMQMMMGAWTAQTLSAVTRLGVPELVHKHGPLTARQLTGEHGVDARTEFLERALRVCASVGVLTETADGRFGPTPLSAVLTPESPDSVRAFVELIGGRWWNLIGALPEALRTGQNQTRALTGREPWESSDPSRREQFGRAMKSRAQDTHGVLPLGDTGASGAKLLDMLMMVSLPGKERTEAEWRALYERAGLRLAAVTVMNPRSAECIVEGVAA